MKKIIELSNYSEPLHHSLPPQRKKISETLEQAPDQELILPLHNPPACWRILNEKVFDTGLFDILRFKQINASICGNSNKYHHLNKIFGSVSYQKANKQIHFFSKKFCKLKKELQALSKELLLTAKTKLQRKEMPAGLKNLDDNFVNCGLSDKSGKEGGKKRKTQKGEKQGGTPLQTTLLTKLQKTRYIVELGAKHDDALWETGLTAKDINDFKSNYRKGSRNRV